MLPNQQMDTPPPVLYSIVQKQVLGFTEKDYTRLTHWWPPWGVLASLLKDLYSKALFYQSQVLPDMQLYINDKDL